MNTPDQHNFTDRQRHLCAACGGRPGHLAGRTGRVAGSGKGAHPRRGCNRGGSKASADGGGGPHHPLIGPHGPVTLLEVFEGRRQLIVYFHMWHTGQPAEGQCEGCTFFNGQVRELSYLHSRDVTYATFCEGPYEESVRYRDFMGWDVPWYSAQDSADALLAGRDFGMQVCYLRHGDRVFETYWNTGRGGEVMVPTYGLLDMTVYGRQETWEDSPAGWPQHWANTGGAVPHGRTSHRPMVAASGRTLR